jgi:hypothetical protein
MTLAKSWVEHMIIHANSASVHIAGMISRIQFSINDVEAFS